MSGLSLGGEDAAVDEVVADLVFVEEKTSRCSCGCCMMRKEVVCDFRLGCEEISNGSLLGSVAGERERKKGCGVGHVGEGSSGLCWIL